MVRERGGRVGTTNNEREGEGACCTEYTNIVREGGRELQDNTHKTPIYNYYTCIVLHA